MVAPTLLLALAACSGSDSGPSKLTAIFPPPASVTVTPPSANVTVGATVHLTAVVQGGSGRLLSDASNSAVSWYSSDTTVAKVSLANGVVTGIHAGVVTITAVADLASDNSVVTVTADSPPTSPVPPTPPAPTPPPVQPTPPSPPSGSSGLTGLALVSDDFTKYSSTAAFLANVSSNIKGGTGSYLTALYNDGANADLAQIDQSLQYNGHATLKYNQPGGSSLSPFFTVYFPNNKTLTKMWFRAKIRFSPGFTTTGTATNVANAYKLLGWGWNTYDGSGRLEITNTNQYDFYWTPISNGSGFGGGDHQSAGSISTEWSDGGWYDYIIECDFSQATDVARVWMARDGQTPVLRATSSGTFSGRAAPGLDFVALGFNFNQVRAPGQTQAIWYGQWEVVDGVAHPDPFKLGIQ